MCRTRCRRSSKPARPYIWRLSILSRWTLPSVGPLLHGIDRPAVTAAMSPRKLLAKLRNSEIGRHPAAARAARQSEINRALGRPLPAAAWSMRNRAIAAAAAVPAVNGFVARRFTMQ